MDSKRRHAEDDVKLRGLQARIKSCALKKQENGEKDDTFIEVKDKDDEFCIKEEADLPINENGLTPQAGSNTDRDARLIGTTYPFSY